MRTAVSEFERGSCQYWMGVRKVMGANFTLTLVLLLVTATMMAGTNIIVLDNGASTIKAGLANSDYEHPRYISHLVSQ